MSTEPTGTNGRPRGQCHRRRLAIAQRLLARLSVGAVMACVIVGLGVGTSSSAQAEPPLFTVGQAVTDHVGALDRDAVTEVMAAVNTVSERTHYRLFVVFVASFDGMSGVQWADQTASQAGLGVNDLLLAIAVDDRLWGLSVDSASDLPPSVRVRVEDAMIPKLRASDWSGAVVAGAEQLSGSVSGIVIGAVLTVVLIVGAAWLFRRLQRRTQG